MRPVKGDGQSGKSPKRVCCSATNPRRRLELIGQGEVGIVGFSRMLLSLPD